MAFLSVSRNRSCRRIPRRASLLDFMALYRQRRRLAQMDDAALDDIGVTRQEARDEARRPVWDVPHHWAG